MTVLQPPNPPIPDAYWVVPGQLLAGEYPGAKDAAAARRKLRLFLVAEFTFFLDLTEEGERWRPTRRCCSRRPRPDTWPWSTAGCPSPT